MIASDLLTHDDNLVPVGAFRATNCCSQTSSGINERISVAPDKIDLTKLGEQILALRFNIQCTIDQVRRLIVKTVRHMEIGLGDRIRLVKIDSSFGTERIVNRFHLPG